MLLSLCLMSQGSLIYGIYLDFFVTWLVEENRRLSGITFIMTVTNSATGVGIHVAFVNYSVVCQ